MLVKHDHETTFDRPADPGRNATQGTLRTFQTELNMYYQDVKTYKDNKGKVFGLLMKQSTHGMQQQLQSHDGFAQLETDTNVVGLIALMKEMTFKDAGT